MSERYPGGYITKSPPTPTATAAPGVWTLDQAMQNVKGGTWPPNGPFWVEDVFSTYLYNGTGSSQTITNGIDLSTKGGLVWVKPRSVADWHNLYDTARGASKSLATNVTNAEADWAGSGVSAFGSTGFTVSGSNDQYNTNGQLYTSWTFRKQAKFFDVVTYTGDGVTTGRAISHNLGSTPGCVIVKRTDTTSDWKVWHRSTTDSGMLNSAAAFSTSEALNNPRRNGYISAADSTTFTVSQVTNGVAMVNASGGTYVAYLFAHDAGGFGASGSDNVISCGSFTTDVSGSATVTLGYEPQFVLFKRIDTASSDWYIFDTAIRFCHTGASFLRPNLSNSEGSQTSGSELIPFQTGFSSNAAIGSGTYIYITIRRGPMKTPTDATTIFTPTVYTGTNVDNRLVNTTIAPDMVWIRQRNSTTVGGMVVGDRLRGQPYLLTGTTDAEVSDADSFDAQLISATEYGTAFSSMSGVWVGNDATSQLNASTTASNQIAEAFKRAPGFFDVVCYTGTGNTTTQNVTHNLGVKPQLMLVKSRGTAVDWQVYSEPTTAANLLVLNSTAASAASSSRWNNTEPTASVFTVGASSGVNASGVSYVAYLFASCPGVSKVGSYTGNGTTQTINCGFASSARFILIKRTDTTGNWYVFDSARGIVTGVNDPYIGLNLTSAEATDDCVGTNSSGFTVTDSTPTFINVDTATYIFLAIA